MSHSALRYVLKFDDSPDSLYVTSARIELQNDKGRCQGESSIEISPGAEKLIKAVLLLGHSNHLDEVITACVKTVQSLNEFP